MVLALISVTHKARPIARVSKWLFCGRSALHNHSTDHATGTMNQFVKMTLASRLTRFLGEEAAPPGRSDVAIDQGAGCGHLEEGAGGTALIALGRGLIARRLLHHLGDRLR